MNLQRHTLVARRHLHRVASQVADLGKSVRLRRQFAEVERRCLELPNSRHAQLAELVRRECSNVERSEDPHSYGARSHDGTDMSGLDVGYERCRSDNAQVRMRGAALWLALVYNETRDSAANENGEMHRQILRLMRKLKVFSSPAAGSARQV